MTDGRASDIGLALCYLAFAAVIVANNRHELAGLCTDMRTWWHKRKPPIGKLWDDVREALAEDE